MHTSWVSPRLFGAWCSSRPPSFHPSSSLLLLPFHVACPRILRLARTCSVSRGANGRREQRWWMRAQAEVMSSHAPTSAVSWCLVQTHPHRQPHPIPNQREAGGREPGGDGPTPLPPRPPSPCLSMEGGVSGRGGGGASTWTKGELTRREFTVGEVAPRRRERRWRNSR